MYDLESAEHLFHSSRPPWPGAVLQVWESATPVSALREVRGAVAGGPWGLRVTLERATFCENRYHLVSWHKIVVH